MVWSLSLFFSLISIINLLKITYYPVIHRVSYENTIYIVLFSNWIDSLLIILFSVISSFLMILKLLEKGYNRLYIAPVLIVLNISALLSPIDYKISIATLAIGTMIFIILGAWSMKMNITITNGLLVIFCIIEAGSLIYWFLCPLALQSKVVDIFFRLSSIETQLFYTPAELTPIAMLVLLFSFPIFLIIRRLRRSTKDRSVTPQLEIRLDGRILLSLAVAITAFITSYPYLPSINPSGKYVGTDIFFYAEWLGQMDAHPEVVEFAIQHVSSRPLFLLLLYYLRLLLKLPTITFLEWMAPPLFCLLPISVFFFGLVMKDRNFAGLVALLSSFSINVVAGMYTAYYSNILALSLLYLSLALLVLSLKRRSYILILPSCALSILALFIHPWTWAFLLVAVCAFMGVRLIHIIKERERLSEKLYRFGPAFVFILMNIMADLLKTLLLAVPSATGISYELAGGAMSFNELFKLWFNLYFTFRIFAGGYFNSFSAIVSAILGVWWLAKQDDLANDLILIWLSIGALPTLFVNFWVNERIFYNLPLPVLSAAGLCFLSSSCTNRKSLSKALLLTFVLLNLNYALRSVASLV